MSAGGFGGEGGFGVDDGRAVQGEADGCPLAGADLYLPFAVEGDDAGGVGDGDFFVRRELPPTLAGDGDDDAGGDGGEDGGAAAAVDGEAAGLEGADGGELAADGGDADVVGLAAGEDELPELANVPDGARADEGAREDGGVDEGDVDGAAVFADEEFFGAADDGGAAGQAAGDDAGGEAGGGAFEHDGEDVVGAGGDGEERYVAAAFGNHAVGAVAAESDDATGAGGGHGGGGVAGVVLGGGEADVGGDEVERQPVLGAEALDGAGDDAVVVWHVDDFVYAGGGEAEQDAADDAGFFLVVEDGAVGDEAADVFAGRGVGDDSYRCHAIPPQGRPGGGRVSAAGPAV